MRGHRSRIRRAVLGCLLMPAMLAIAPQLSAAAGWSTVNLPEHSGLNAVFCRSSRWCEAVGTNHRAQAEHWNGSRWSIEHAVKPAAPRGYRSAHTYLNAIACRGARFCLAVGSLVPVGTGNSPGRRSSSAGTARAGSCTVNAAGHRTAGLGLLHFVARARRRRRLVGDRGPRRHAGV